MKTCTVFYASLVYGEYDCWQPSADLPDGAYIHYLSTSQERLWYLVQHSAATPINLADIPNEIRMLALLLN